MPLLATRLLVPTSRFGRAGSRVRGVTRARARAGQYPGEKEITFPPYTCLEAHGDARLERDAKGNEVVIFPLKVPPTPQPPRTAGPPHARAAPVGPCAESFPSRYLPRCTSSDCPAAARLLLLLLLGNPPWRVGIQCLP